MDSKFLHLTNLKAGTEDGLEEGQVLAYASTWTREPDSYGDVVAKGAFKDTISEWMKSGNTLPILYGHDMADPFANIGGALELAEDDRGLLVKAALDIHENPTAKQVYRLLKGRRISQLSFAFDILEDGMVDLGDEKSARELRKLKLYEVSFVPIGANQDTEVLAVKAAANYLKAGRVLSAKNLETIKSAHAALDAVIKAAETDSDDTDDETNSAASSQDGGQEPKSASKRAKSALATASFIASL